jgi:hypothetical protein
MYFIGKEELMIIGNFTPDDIPWTHVGIHGVIKSGEVVEVEEGRGNFILTKNGRRGLVRMQYGDDEEAQKKKSMDLWKSFWEQQVTVQNQANEEQKEKGQRYAKPTQELIDHAEALGLEILRPWTVTKPSARDDKAVEELKKENQELKSTITDIQTQMSQLIAIVTADKQEPQQDQKADTVVEANRKKYRSLREGTLMGWIRNAWDEIEAMPEENKLEIKELYQVIYKENFPVQKPA